MRNATSHPATAPVKGKRATERNQRKRGKRARSDAATPDATEHSVSTGRLQQLAGVAILVAGLWAYGDTLVSLVHTWSNQPDYSHGFLVVPLALYFLWLRRNSFPGLTSGSLVLSLPFLAISILLRYLDGTYFLRVLDGWSLVLWSFSAVAALGGIPLVRWSFPALGFLIFMVPLPFSAETFLSLPLQRVATKVSTWCLQVLGQPAFAEGNVILMGEERLDVAQACSGLRLFVSMIALAYVYVVLVRRTWWEKLLLVVALFPISIISNSARVVATGLLYRATTDPGLRKLAHDFAGIGMILFAAALFGLVLWYLRLLIREEEVMDAAALARAN